MKNITKHIGVLNIVERMKNSVNGNPRYRLFIVENDAGTGVSCVTAPDSAHGYRITNFEGKRVSVAIGTLRGKATLDAISLANSV